jgi:hypothetical protein
MLIPKANTKKIYDALFNEGVVVAKKDFSAPKHPEIDVPNLHVIKTMQSLVSKKLVREQFAWRHYYWYLENEGIEVCMEMRIVIGTALLLTVRVLLSLLGQPACHCDSPEASCGTYLSHLQL